MNNRHLDFDHLPTLNKHDLLEALLTFDLLIQEIESGYKFDDSMALKIIERSKYAKQVIETYLKLQGIKS